MFFNQGVPCTLAGIAAAKQLADENWAELLRLAVANRAYTGTAPLPIGFEAGAANGSNGKAGPHRASALATSS